MGLFLRQNEDRSKLQSRLASELKGKLNEQQKVESEKVDPKFLEDNHKATPASMVILVLGIILVIAFIVWFIIYTANQS